MTANYAIHNVNKCALSLYCSMESTEITVLKTLVYEYYRLWTDKYGYRREPPVYFLDVVDLLEKRYGLFFNTQTWQWERV